MDEVMKTRPKFAKLNDSDIPSTGSNLSDDENFQNNEQLLQIQTLTTTNKLVSMYELMYMTRFY